MVNWNSVKKKDHLVLVIPRKKLFGENNELYFQGFSKIDLTLQLSKNLGFLTRGKVSSKETHENDGIFAESDPNYKQIIPYVIVINKETKKVYAYKRASKSNEAHEARLHGNWSWGVGGHVDFQENFFSKDSGEFLKENLMRELTEEIKLNNGEILSTQLLGFINDDSDPVGEVHFGIIFIAETNSTNIEPNDAESKEGKFLSIGELEEIATTPGVKCDNWSRICVKALKDILS